MADDDSHFTPRNIEPADWERIKAEVHRLYIVENKPLKLVQAQLQAIYGFQACISIWKKKVVGEWKFLKNFPASTMNFIVAVEAQRAQKRKRTVFYCEDTLITQERIENFKKTRCRGFVPPLAPVPPSDVRYHTPSPENEGDSSEKETYEKLTVCLSTSTQVPSSSLGHACSVCFNQWEMEPGETHRIDLPDEPQFSLLGAIDRWFLDEHQPWSQFEMSHQPNYHDDTVVKDRNLSEEFGEFGLPSEEDDVWPDLPNYVLQPFLEPRPIIAVEQEEAALKDVPTLAGKLPRYLRENQEYTPQALKVRFELAEALVGIGKYDEAEGHCRDLIAIDSQESVAALLGTILAKTSRLEESTKWLFIALANFILNCTKYSLQQNEQLFSPIYYLFAELLWMIEQDWGSLAETLREMMVTLNDLRSDEDIHRACPELFIHGFHLAHNCMVLNLVYPAKYLYEHLLEPSSSYLNGRHASEKANAHHMYGLLLSGEKNWSSSAEQLLLTCKSIIESGSYTYKHVAFLTITFNNICLHLPSENDRPGSTVKKIETKLDYMKNQISVSSNGFSDLPVENFWQSNLPGLQAQQLILPVRSIVLSQGRTDSNSALSRRGTVAGGMRVSKKSASSGPMSSGMSGDGSHENGETWSISEWDEYANIRGICDKMSKTS